MEVTDDFLDYCSDCSLAIEVWGHRSTGFLSGIVNELGDQPEYHKPKSLKEKYIPCCSFYSFTNRTSKSKS